ncbi:hypothetical protein ACP6JD_004991 [Aspergillus fumigatus]
MSGNYDYPPASRRVPRASRTSDRSQPHTENRLQHLRELLSSERHRDSSATTRALEILNQEIEEYRSSRARNWTSFEQAREAVDRQIQLLQAATPHRGEQTHGADHTGHPRLVTQRSSIADAARLNPSTVPSNSIRSTSDGRPPRRRPMRTRHQEGRNRAPVARSLLDELVPLDETISAMPLEPGTDLQGDSRRAKRRKLESDDKREGPQAFRYGHYGQVVPGALKMEIKMCDGGTYDDSDGENSWPENILRNDSAVYCTKSDRCNLILKHRGDAPFCLSKIDIKAPKSGYNAPVQEGMVFVSMAYDDVLARTAAFKVLRPSPRRSNRSRRTGLQPSEEYLNAFRTPLQTLERAVFGNTDSPSDSDSDIRTIAGPDAPDPMAEFQVTTEYDGASDNDDGCDMDDEDDADDVDGSESDESETERGIVSDEATFYRRRDEMLQRIEAVEWSYEMEQRGLERRRRIPNRAELAASSAPPESRPLGPSSPPVLKPHARFSIERAKSMVSIKFDPPASGRYILIKLWNPRNDGNIDIRSIITYGFAGPRFFPAGEFR